MIGVVFFDVDGTLVPNTSSAVHITASIGHLDEVLEADRLQDEGLIDESTFVEIDARGWLGWTPHRIEAVVEDLPLIEGIAETVAWCDSRGLHPCLATVAFKPVGKYLTGRFGFQGFGGPEPELVNGVYSGKVLRHFNEFDKRDTASEFALQRGFSAQQCAAVGDGWSDLPLFEFAGFSVALNASPAAIEAADVAVEARSLTEVIPLLEPWVETLF